MVERGANLSRVGRSPSALAVEVYEQLLDAMMEGRLKPGDRLVMDRLAEELDVSRTPVRDALLRLHREGVVEPAGRRGYLVRPSSDSDIHHFYEARMAVEGFAAELLAQAGADPLNKVRALLDEIAAVPLASTRDSFDANRRFHRGIVEATGNAYLVDMFDAIWNRSRTALTYRDFMEANPNEDFVPEHEALIAALDGVTADKARAAMVDHIASGLDRTRPAGA